MVEPTSDVSFVIERVVPSDAPDRFVVVDRRLSKSQTSRHMDERRTTVREARRQEPWSGLTPEDQLNYELQLQRSQLAAKREATGGSANQP